MPLSAEDRSEIQNLAGRYSHALDLGEPEAWRSVWTDDAVMEMITQKRWITGDELWSLAGSSDPDGPQGRHMPSTFNIEGDGDDATMRSYVTVMRTGDGGPAHVVFQGRYEDVLRREDGAWKLAHRTIHTDWIDADTAREVTAEE